MAKGDRDFAVEIVLVSLEDRVRQDGEDDVEVSCGSAARAGLPLARGAEAGTGVDSCRDFEFDAGVFFGPSFPVAGLAGILDRLA